MIILKSWGFKYGEPEANFKFDVSYLKNPWRTELRDSNKKELMEFMEKQNEFETMSIMYSNIIYNLYKMYPDETLIFSFCCSAGEYRSPLMVEKIKDLLNKLNVPSNIKHSSYSKI